MKRINFLAIILCFIPLLYSCEDVIVLDLQEEEARLVIESYVDISAQKAVTKISNSNGFYDSTEQIMVEGATVKLVTENETFTYTQESTGVYNLDIPEFLPNESLRLEIELNNEIYIAETKVPNFVELSAINFSEFTFPFGDSDTKTYQISSTWTDNLEEENYYRIRPYENGEIIPNIFSLIRDDGMEGKEITLPIRYPFEGDNTISIELLSTSKEYYDYFIQLKTLDSQGLDGGNPYNPIGNFNNANVLGYFGAFTTSLQEVEL